MDWELPVEVVMASMVEESSGLNVGASPHERHSEEATHRSDEPVSRMIWNDCAGVPTVMVPM